MDGNHLGVHIVLAPSMMEMIDGIYKCLSDLKERHDISKYLIIMDESHYIDYTAASALLTNTNVVDAVIGYENLFVKLQFNNGIDCTIVPFRTVNGNALGLSSEYMYIIPCKEKEEIEYDPYEQSE